MLRTALDRELLRLQDEILMVGSEVEENLVKVVDVLRRRDMGRSRQLIHADEWVNDKRIQIGMSALTLIATQQPIAKDMRRIAATLEIAGELERIHDYVKGIAKINLMIGSEPIIEPLIEHLPQMAALSRDMLHQSLSAFVAGDAEFAARIPQTDNEVDALFKATHRQMIQYILANPTEIEHAHWLEWAAHNLERSADRVTNICEWVVYLATGVYQEMDTSLAS